jgi:hypothetical protein
MLLKLKSSVSVSLTIALLLFAVAIPAVFADQAATAPLTTSATTGPYLIAYKFVAGRSLKYSTAMDMQMQTNALAQAAPNNIHMDMAMTQTVESIDPTSGAATQQTEANYVDESMNGQPLPTTMLNSSMSKSFTTVIAPNGQMLSMTSPPGQPQVPGFSMNSFIGVTFLPKTPVNVGDTWTASMPMASVGIALNMVMALQSVENVNGHTVAVIASHFTSVPITPTAGTAVPMMKITAVTGDGITDFDLTSGEIVRNAATTTDDMSMALPNAQAVQAKSMNMHMAMKMTMTLVPQAGN